MVYKLKENYADHYYIGIYYKKNLQKNITCLQIFFIVLIIEAVCKGFHNLKQKTTDA